MSQEALIKSNIKTLKQELQQTQKEHSEILLLKSEAEKSVDEINNVINERKKELSNIENIIKDRTFENDNLIDTLMKKQSESMMPLTEIENSIMEKISILNDEVALKQQEVRTIKEEYNLILEQKNKIEKQINANQNIIINQEKRIKILNDKKQTITNLIIRTQKKTDEAYRDRDIISSSLELAKKELKDVKHRNEVLLKQEVIVKENIKKKKILEGDIKVLEDRITIMKDKNLKVALDDKVNEHRNKK